MTLLFARFFRKRLEEVEGESRRMIHFFRENGQFEHMCANCIQKGSIASINLDKQMLQQDVAN